MAKKKKDKKPAAKKSAKAQRRKKQKRKLKSTKAKAGYKRAGGTRMPHMSAPPATGMNAPPGFLAVSVSQAVMEYSKALFDSEASESVEDMNSTFQLTSLIWNYGIAAESGDVDEKLEKEVLDNIQRFWEVDRSKARELLEKFVVKKNEMFPPDAQVRGSPMMYMRKLTPRLIPPFDYGKLQLSPDIFPPDQKDGICIDRLETIDGYLRNAKDYSEWEDEYFAMEEACNESFSNWLKKKGTPDYIVQDFPFLAEIFLNFVYRYIHDHMVVLKSVDATYFEEFLFNHVLRKVMMEPHEHVDWPPTLKLFYNFLYEKEYIEDATPFIQIIDDLEPQFVDFLRERFG